VLSFDFADSAVVFLKQVKTCRASPAVVLSRTVTSPNTVSTVTRTISVICCNVICFSNLHQEN
jgi:hypothetical protein